ncbi:MAG TPA: hypothetical protein VML55_11535, partial [Planctomycetaceae bacterium]|nr:hypothetical protein [Planctomycetaceae bacterium]
AFGAAYLAATTDGRPCASEPYLMSRGNPYGTHSFPKHERLARTLLAVTHGNVTAQSFGWQGQRESSVDVCGEVRKRAPWLLRARPLCWAAMLVSEQTRQFYAYRNIAELFLPHAFGGFRAALEEHLPLGLINDWDLTADELRKYQVLVLPNAAALSDAQIAAVREFVAGGGGLVATGETSLCDELGQPRGDFGLGDVFGVSFRGRPQASAAAPVALDENFARHLDENYWKQRRCGATVIPTSAACWPARSNGQRRSRRQWASRRPCACRRRSSNRSATAGGGSSSTCSTTSTRRASTASRPPRCRSAKRRCRSGASAWCFPGIPRVPAAGSRTGASCLSSRAGRCWKASRSRYRRWDCMA